DRYLPYESHRRGAPLGAGAAPLGGVEPVQRLPEIQGERARAGARPGRPVLPPGLPAARGARRLRPRPLPVRRPGESSGARKAYTVLPRAGAHAAGREAGRAVRAEHARAVGALTAPGDSMPA